MESFSTVEGKICPVPIKDIDTDMIIPAQFLTSISRDGFGAHLFTRLRDNDPSFPLNLPMFRGAEILVGDSNFGCGSSREHAVWAILGAGFKVVIAKNFADIFSSNSGKNGLLLIKLPEAPVEYLLQEGARRELRLRVDLEAQVVSEIEAGGVKTTWKFDYDPFLKYCLLNGLDELDYLRSQRSVIDEKRAHLEGAFFFDARTPNWPPADAVPTESK
jgi:3-isopropylmalate/(R)-2-methylmalate dehydratase small subunit